MSGTSPEEWQPVAERPDERPQQGKDAVAPQMNSDNDQTVAPVAAVYPYFARYGYRDRSRKYT
jgi:hypothetical protein